MYTDPANALLGFAGDTEDLEAGSQLVAVDATTGELTPVGPSLGVWVMGAAMNDDGDLWVTVFDTYELNATTQVSIAQIDPATGEILDGPTVLTENDAPVTVWSIHVSDVAFRFDGAMFILNLALPPLLDEALLYADPIPTNSGTADLAGCAKLEPQ